MRHFYSKIFFSLLSILTPILLQAQSLTWSSEINVAMGSMYGNVRPRIAIAAGNVPLVMWYGNRTSLCV
jgi:hypothetical protein